MVFFWSFKGNFLQKWLKNKCKQKAFVVHLNFQQLLATIWYESLPGWRRMNIISQVKSVIFLWNFKGNFLKKWLKTSADKVFLKFTFLRIYSTLYNASLCDFWVQIVKKSIFWKTHCCLKYWLILTLKRSN